MIDYVPWRKIMVPDAVVLLKSAGRDGGMTVGVVDKVGRKTVGVKLLSKWDIESEHLDVSVATENGLYSIPAEVKKVNVIDDGWGYVTIVPLSHAAKIDKRKAERYNVGIPVMFRPVDSDKFYEGIMVDISWAGCRLVWMSPEDIRLTKIVLRTKIGPNIEDILGRVVWRRRGDDRDYLGIEFLDHTSRLFRIFSDIVGIENG